MAADSTGFVPMATNISYATRDSNAAYKLDAERFPEPKRRQSVPATFQSCIGPGRTWSKQYPRGRLALPVREL